MNDDSQSPSPNDPDMFRFVEAGMSLTYEFRPLGVIKAPLGQIVEFCPVFTCQGFSDHKKFVASLRLRHLVGRCSEISRCILDRDEVFAWSQLLRYFQKLEYEDLNTRNVEYVSRHGIKLVLKCRANEKYVPFLLHVASSQAAILPEDFASEMVEIFEDFESLCREYT